MMQWAKVIPVVPWVAACIAAGVAGPLPAQRAQSRPAEAGAGGKKTPVALTWREPKPKAVFLSDLSEKPGTAVQGPIEVPAFGLVTLRAELGE